MIKKNQTRKLETAVVMPLEVVEALSPETAKRKLLSVLLKYALEGDVRAAKLYLDYSFRANVEERSGLTLEQAMQLMNSQEVQTASEDDNC